MITYLTGDASNPIGERPCIITHVVNNVPAWGAGFVMAVSKRYPVDRSLYMDWVRGWGPFTEPAVFGGILPLEHDDGVTDVLLLAQNNIGRMRDGIPLDYDALASALAKLAEYGPDQPIHMPRIGCGLAGGTWDRVGPMVDDILRHRAVYVYDLPVTR